MKKKLLTLIIICGLSILVNQIQVEASTPDFSNKKVMVGYYHNWNSSGGDGYAQGTSKQGMQLTDISKEYNVIDVAFLSGSGNSMPSFTPHNISPTEFKNQVEQLNQEGRAVLMSLGGANAHISLQKGQEIEYANAIIDIAETYGFNGIDIDLEGSSISAGSNQTVLPEALKIVKNHFADKDEYFMITMAPEFPYLRNNGAYVPYITALEGYYDFIHPQFYNQAGDGIIYNSSYIAQNSDNQKYEFLMGMSEALINGDQGYVKIPADKLVLGLPANIDAAANGFVYNPQDVYNTFDDLSKQGHDLKGIMTWSINWDEGKNKVGESYDKQFSKDYKDLIYPKQNEMPESSDSSNTTPTNDSVDEPSTSSTNDESDSTSNSSDTSSNGSTNGTISEPANSANHESSSEINSQENTDLENYLPETGVKNNLLLIVIGIILFSTTLIFVLYKKLYPK